MNDLVIMQDQQAVTTSLKVAEVFDKKHQHVMEAIRNLTAENSTVENSTVEKMFEKSSYINLQKHEQPMYYMNRDGFSLLAMGFTGKKALSFKLKYIEAFNEMEKFIKQRNAISIDSKLEHEKLAYKREWLIEMRKQNVNKAHELRNQDVKLYLELGKVADDYQRPHMAVDFRNEAIRAMQALPVGARREYSATEIGNMIGVSPIAIGKWANKLGVKRDADMSYRDHDGAWRYFPEALKVFQDNALEIQDDDLGL